jgi:hypothetical protein
MKPWARQSVLLLLLLAAACSAIYDVSYDFDAEMDLTDYGTYEWLPIPEALRTDSILVKRVKSATDARLSEKGFRMTADNPDFLIAMHVGSEEKVTQRDWGYTYSRHWRGGGGGRRYFRYQEGTLVLDFVDGKSRQLAWRGQAKGFVDKNSNPRKDEKLVNEAVRKILKHFPPR